MWSGDWGFGSLFLEASRAVLGFVTVVDTLVLRIVVVVAAVSSDKN